MAASGLCPILTANVSTHQDIIFYTMHLVAMLSGYFPCIFPAQINGASGKFHTYLYLHASLGQSPNFSYKENPRESSLYRKENSKPKASGGLSVLFTQFSSLPLPLGSSLSLVATLISCIYQHEACYYLHGPISHHH